MTAYYNEIDPFVAQWLRELINVGKIAPGYVDERSIEDVTANDLKGFTQCHFFAGIGAWSYALRLAGWPDNRPVWTGSCPCQPFSSAGKGVGFADKRHLWPAWHHLIKQHNPAAVFGEQVASKDGLSWLDLVQTDMEATGYAFAPFDLCAAGFGSPQIRQRLFFVAESMANTSGKRLPELGRKWQQYEGFATNSSSCIVGNSCIQRLQDSKSQALFRARGWQEGRAITESGVSPLRMADNLLQQRQSATTCGNLQGRWEQKAAENTRLCTTGRLAESESSRSSQRETGAGRQAWDECAGLDSGMADTSSVGLDWRRSGETSNGQDSAWLQSDRFCDAIRPGPTNGQWGNADWLLCRDGKWRPVEPGTFPLVNGAAARVGRLRGYGNAIVAEQAEKFIEAYLGSF